MNKLINETILMVEIDRGERGIGVSQISKVVHVVKQ